MCKEGGAGQPAVYEIKGNDHIRHIDKTAQDKLPVSERARVIAAAKRVVKEDREALNKLREDA